MNKETLESYMKAIDEELEMMKGKSITSQVLRYLDELMHTYHKLEKCMGSYEDKKYEDYTDMDKDHKDYMIVEDCIEKYKCYCHYKEMYKENQRQGDLEMAHDALKHLLNMVVEMFEEIEEYSRDDMEERAMVKGKVKECYQLFN